MINNLEERKAKLKTKLCKEIDEYFDAFESSSNQDDFDINVIEKLMLENQGKIKASLNDATSELAGNVAVGVKKTAQNAETL